MPLSGALGGSLAGDLRRTTPDHLHALRVLEVKRRKSPPRTLLRWLAQGSADAVVIVPEGDGMELVVMTRETLQRVLDEAGYRRGGA